jgi:2'-5' RNA ligase
MPRINSQARLEQPKPRTDGLFFAVIPTPQSATQIARRMQDFRGDFGLQGKPLATDHFHVTLYYLGAHAGLPLGIIAKASETAAFVRMAPFGVTFDCARTFTGKGGSRPFVLGSSKALTELQALQQSLRMALRRAGLDNWTQPVFTPHVTLLYDNRRVPEQAIEPVGWTVREFVLMRSLLGMSRYETLGRWPLQEPAE